MLSPLPSVAESGTSQYKSSVAESYSTHKESASSRSEIGADGTTVTKVDYSSQRSSYTVSLSSSGASDKSLTYSSLSQSYQLSSASVKGSDSSIVQESGQSSNTQSLSSAGAAGAVSDASPLLDGAKNILKFIEQRIASEKADGASEAELAELWEQGLKGFVQGFNEAYGILEETGQLANEAVSESVSKMSEQVYAGFDAIYEQYIGDSGANDSGVNKGAVSEADNLGTVTGNASPVLFGSNKSEVNNSNSPRQFLSSGQLSEQFNVIGNGGSLSSNSALADLVSSLGDNIDAVIEYGRKDTFTFELKTLDGDTISINASNTAVFVGEYASATDASDEKNIEGMKDKNDFTMDVVGELDEQERVAIESLLNQVMSLADEFYNGDIDKAYEAAMDLGYDQNEIASYAINLRQTEQFSVAAAYQDLQPSVSPDAKDVLASIGDFAQSVLETLNKPENYEFFDYTQLLRGISEQIDQQIKPASTQSFKDAVEQLVDTASVESVSQNIPIDRPAV